MVLKYTTNTQKKLEQLFADAGYRIRYERGAFTSGYCVMQNRKVVVINKYFTMEARINCMADILLEVNIDESELSEPSAKLYRSLKSAQTPGS